jgi:flagellar biosynthesis/type III secretory pathway chaperone
MSTSASRTPHTPLHAVLRDVHATLGELLEAADEQYAAAVAGDPRRLEAITARQERLAARLERFERRRLDLLAGRPLGQAIAALPADEAGRAGALNTSISQAVRDLQQRHDRTASLLRKSAELAGQTIEFLQRVLCAQPLEYGRRGLSRPTQSLIVDSRA